MKSGSNFKPGFRKFQREQPADAHRINHRIKVPQVRLVHENGEQFGIRPTQEALRMAEDYGLDLVEVAPQANPPVCKIMDYGKFKYREQKKEAEAKKKRVEVETKELRIRYTTDVGDFTVKVNKAREFILEGNKVKFSMMFHGREIAYMELGLEKLKEVEAALQDVAIIDDQSPRAGRVIYVTFAPKKK